MPKLIAFVLGIGTGVAPSAGNLAAANGLNADGTTDTTFNATTVFAP